MNIQRDFIVAIILIVTVLTAGSRELPAQRKAGVKRNMTVSGVVPAQQDVSAQRTEENTATLQETLDWLQSQMSILKTYTKTGDPSDVSGGDNTDVSRFEPGSFNSCTIVWREITGNSIVTNRYISEITIPLSDIDPHNIRVRDVKCLGGGDCYYVELSTTKKSIKVHYSTIDDLTDLRVSQPRDTKTTRVVLLDSLTLVETEQDEELAHRISGAMKHAVKLCCSGSNCNSNLPVVDSELPQEAAEKAALKHVFSEICPALLILPNLKAERVCADVRVDCSENPPLTSADKANGLEDKWCVEVGYTMRSKPPPNILREWPEWPDAKTSVLSYKRKGIWKAARIDVGNCACRKTLEAR